MKSPNRKTVKKIRSVRRKSPNRNIVKKSRSVRRKSPNRKTMKKIRSVRRKSPNRNIVKKSRSVRRKSPNRNIVKKSRSVRRKSPNRNIVKKIRSVRRKSPNRNIVKKSRSVYLKSPNRKNIRLRGGVNKCEVCGSTQNLVMTNKYMGVETYKCENTKKEKCRKQAAENNAKKKQAEREQLKQEQLAAKEKEDNDRKLDIVVSNIIREIQSWEKKRKRNLKKKFKNVKDVFTSISDEDTLAKANDDLEEETKENLAKIEKLASDQMFIIERESPFYVANIRRIKEEERKEIKRKEREEYQALKDSSSLTLREDQLSKDDFESLTTYKTLHREREALNTRRKLDNAVRESDYYKQDRILITYSVDSINKQNIHQQNAHSIEVHCSTLRPALEQGPVGESNRDKFFGHVSLYIYRDDPTNPEIYHFGINPHNTSIKTLIPEFWPSKELLEQDRIRLSIIPSYQIYFPEHNSAKQLLLDYYEFCIASCPIRTLGHAPEKLKSLREMTSWRPKTPEDDDEDDDEDLPQIDPGIENLSYGERLTRIQDIGLELRTIREADSTGRHEQDDSPFTYLKWDRRD